MIRAWLEDYFIRTLPTSVLKGTYQAQNKYRQCRTENVNIKILWMRWKNACIHILHASFKIIYIEARGSYYKEQIRLQIKKKKCINTYNLMWQRSLGTGFKGAVAWDFWACFLACLDASRPECEALLVFKF
jgi:hypothetical protein